MAGRGKKLSDAYVELHADDSKLTPEVRVKAERASREFGGTLNKSLKRLRIDPIDIKASPREALAAVKLTETRLHDLARNAETVEVKIRTESALKNLGTFKKKLGDVGDSGGKAAEGFASRFGARIGPLLASAPLSPPMLIAAGAAGAAIAPLLGGLVAGGVIGGAGIGGVIGGLVTASNDARVATAATRMGERMKERFQEASVSFVQPALDGMSQLERAIGGINIEHIFRDSARFVPVLTKGVTAALSDLGDGFESLVGNADPVIEALSRSVASIGSTLGDSFKLLSTDADAGASSIKDLTDVVNFFITSTVGLVHGLAEIKSGLDSMYSGTRSAVEGIEDFLTKMSGGRAEFDLTADGMSVLEARTKATADATKAAATTSQTAAGIFGGFKTVIEDTGAAAAGTAVKFEAMHDASQRIVNTNLSAAEATLSLRNAVVAAGEAIDKRSRVTRAEEDALLAMARATNSSTKALDEQGRTTADATRAHETNRKKLIETATQMGYSKKRARELADQYLATPKNVTTKVNQPGEREAEARAIAYRKRLDEIARQVKTSITVTGDRAAYGKLVKLLVAQQALSKGISVSAAQSAFNKNAYASGGYTGPGAKYEPAGIVHRDEFVIRKESRQRIESRAPGLLDQMNATGKAPGYATGGQVWPFRVTAAKTKIMTMAEALSKVVGVMGGNWPSSPGAQRGDSGVWRRIVALIRSTGPMSGQFGNGYRPGDPKWHGSGRAVDWMGFNQDRLARFLAARKPLELIHRTKTRDYAYTRGRNMGSFNEGLMNAHRNHIHIAYAGGGRVLPIQQVASADTGRATLKQGWNLLQNSTGKPEHMSTGSDETVGIWRDMLAEMRRLAPSIGDRVGQHVAGVGTRADVSLGSRSGLYERTAF